LPLLIKIKDKLLNAICDLGHNSSDFLIKTSDFVKFPFNL